MDLLEQKIVSLIDNNMGDSQRLNEMLDRHRSGKELYNSDIDYLERLSPTTITPKIEEKPINLDELRKSQPKPKYKKYTIKFAVSYSQSRRGSAKLHKGNCHNTLRSSQEGDIKWNYYYSYSEAKHALELIGSKQPYGSKNAGCCMNNFISNIISGGIISCFLLGIIGGLLAWYFTRDYFGTWSRIWLVVGGLWTTLLLYFVGIGGLIRF